MTTVVIGEPLSWQQVAAISLGARCELSKEAASRLAHARRLVESVVAQGMRAYGVNTGVGALCDVIIDRSEQSRLSRSIVMTHACGVGVPLAHTETRAIIASAINGFARGGSGVRPIIAEALIALLTNDCIPVVPARGSIGYLSHMAHVALVLIGTGSARLGSHVMDGAEALARIGREPLRLEAKEGLSLVNGAPCAIGLSAVALDRMKRLLDWADVIAAMTIENLGTNVRSFGAEALAFNASEGVTRVGSRLRAMLEKSQLVAFARERTQDAMSLRAVPHVHGAAYESWLACGSVVDRELRSITDNPIVSGPLHAPQVHSQAHAVTTALALAVDALAIAAAKLAAMSERRIDRLVNPLLSSLPAFLAKAGGASSGLMIAQYTALSLASENRRLAAPASLDGGVSSGLQEDEIPHSTPAALKALQIIENVETILSIELIASAQAYDLRNSAHGRAPATDTVYRSFREHVCTYADERPLAMDISAAVEFLRNPMPITLS